jgi:hypothetical protein
MRTADEETKSGERDVQLGGVERRHDGQMSSKGWVWEEREIRCEERCFRQLEVVLEGGLGEDLDGHQDHRHRRRQRSSWHVVAPRARWAAPDQRGAVCLLLFNPLDLTESVLHETNCRRVDVHGRLYEHYRNSAPSCSR